MASKGPVEIKYQPQSHFCQEAALVGQMRLCNQDSLASVWLGISLITSGQSLNVIEFQFPILRNKREKKACPACLTGMSEG